jgi:DME family drug/metabolite transporter
VAIPGGSRRRGSRTAKVITIVAGLLGVAALAVARAHEGPGAGDSPLLGITLGLLAGLLYAMYSWAAARIMRTGLPAHAVIGSTFGLGGLLLLPVLAATGLPIVQDGHSVAVVAYLAIVPMFLGYLLFGRGLVTTSVSMATTLSLLEPAVAAAIAVVALNERLPPLGVLGLALLLVSVAILRLKLPMRNPLAHNREHTPVLCPAEGH